MAAAVRSLLAPWIGGASAPQVTPGVRSMLAFWMGGAVVGPEVATRNIIDGRPRLRSLRRDRDEADIAMIVKMLIENEYI